MTGALKQIQTILYREEKDYKKVARLKKTLLDTEGRIFANTHCDKEVPYIDESFDIRKLYQDIELATQCLEAIVSFEKQLEHRLKQAVLNTQFNREVLKEFERSTEEAAESAHACMLLAKAILGELHVLERKKFDFNQLKAPIGSSVPENSDVALQIRQHSIKIVELSRAFRAKFDEEFKYIQQVNKVMDTVMNQAAYP